jgi:hypothetical protein
MDNLEILWGIDAIGRFINRSRDQTYRMLKSGRIDAAQKCGDLWFASKDGLRAQFNKQPAGDSAA